MTPVRNEAWVLRAYLESTSRWADYIVIADQMSTDGSRDIIKEYAQKNASTQGWAQIVMIDNDNPEFNESERQSMLINKAREIAAGRDTLLWGLDADEVLAANAFDTKDWQRILNSKPGDVFWFRWAQLCPNQREYWQSTSYPWLFHDDGKEPHGNYVRNMHSMRIPYPIEEKQMYYVRDFYVLHFAYLNVHRVMSKSRFYQFVDWEMNHRSPISLSRSYRASTVLPTSVRPITKEMLYTQFDILKMVDAEVARCYMDEYIVERLPRHEAKELRRLDIWDEDFCKTYGLADPRTVWNRLVHHYLQLTLKKRERLLVRLMDKLLK